tara:strand:- start:1264 stop:1476 length:213 start_codon:yes stop_codon:yes gene_type:complete
MSRELRNLISKKQQNITIEKGAPRTSDLKEGVISLRYVNGEMYIYTKYLGQLYKRRMIKAEDREGIDIII